MVTRGCLQFAEPVDQFLRWILAGLDPDSADFAVLPPHFKVGPKENVDVAQALKISFGEICKQHKATGLLMFCLDSIILHIKFIRDYAAKNPSHDFNKLPILQMPALVEQLRHLVTIEQSDRIPEPTGIPPHVNHTIILSEGSLVDNAYNA